jgi:hypothetical protein
LSPDTLRRFVPIEPGNISTQRSPLGALPGRRPAMGIQAAARGALASSEPPPTNPVPMATPEFPECQRAPAPQTALVRSEHKKSRRQHPEHASSPWSPHHAGLLLHTPACRTPFGAAVRHSDFFGSPGRQRGWGRRVATAPGMGRAPLWFVLATTGRHRRSGSRQGALRRSSRGSCCASSGISFPASEANAAACIGSQRYHVPSPCTHAPGGA